jgi:malate dehydrogenase (oxaloacetate-decarboxylating)(NADP+)
MVTTMAPRPIILALANPDPEIMPEDARSEPDAIIARAGLIIKPGEQCPVFPYIFVARWTLAQPRSMTR